MCVCFLFYVFFIPLMMMDEAAPLDHGCRWCVTWSESFNHTHSRISSLRATTLALTTRPRRHLLRLLIMLMVHGIAIPMCSRAPSKVTATWASYSNGSVLHSLRSCRRLNVAPCGRCRRPLQVHLRVAKRTAKALAATGGSTGHDGGLSAARSRPWLAVLLCAACLRGCSEVVLHDI